MKSVRAPELDLDLELVRERWAAAMQWRSRERAEIAEARFVSSLDVPALLIEIKRLLWVEREHRREFADLLHVARSSLAAADAGDRFALDGLRWEVERHREITTEEVDQWRDWSDQLTETDPDRKEASDN